MQWDRTVVWLGELNPNFNLGVGTIYANCIKTVIPLTEYNSGAKYSDNYGESYQVVIAKNENDEYMLTTGAYKKANVYNIYDMLGNLNELTMEHHDYQDYGVSRGGDAYSTSTSAALRTPSLNGDYYAGFRPSLYIK